MAMANRPSPCLEEEEELTLKATDRLLARMIQERVPSLCLCATKLPGISLRKIQNILKHHLILKLTGFTEVV